MKARHVLGAIALAGLAGCSSPAPAEVAAPATPAAAAASQGALPACSDVFVADKPVVGFDDQTGCTNREGTVQFISAVDCSDGTKLWPVDATTGAPAGFGRQGKAYQLVKGDVAADKSYKEAYEACVNDSDSAASPAPSGAAK